MARKEVKRQQIARQGIVNVEASDNGSTLRRVISSKFFLVGIQLSILFFGLTAKGVILNFFGS